MPRTAIPITQVQGGADPAFITATTVTADDTNEHDWLMVDGDILLAFNTGAGAHNVTLVGTADYQGRVANSSQAVGAGALAVFGPLKSSGWKQTDGKVHVDTDDAVSETEFAVIRGAV